MKYNFTKNVVNSLKKYTPEILIGLGLTGMMSATVLAVRATPKALTLIEEKKERDGKDELTPLETADACWKCYIPAGVITVVSILCIMGADSVNIRRNAALAAAYSISETALLDYQKAVTESVGEKKEREIHEAAGAEAIRRDPLTGSNMVLGLGGGETLCYDSVSGRYFKSDIETIRKAVNEINYRLRDECYMSLNEFYDEIELPHIAVGDDLGWSIETGMLDIAYGTHLSEDGRPCLVLSYLVAPTYGFR